MMKKGLILEGGAMRGLFTAGVLDILLDAGIEFDGIIGVSAGAAFGCNYKSGQKGRVLRYNKRFCRDPRYCSWRSWLKTGNMFGADFCYHQLPDLLDIFDYGAYDRDPAEFWVVCTDVQTGKPVYHQCPKADYECYEWMRASASMPVISRIVEVGGGKYLDGALTDPIPLRFFEEQGYDRNVVILTQPAGYIKQKQNARLLLKLLYHRYPDVARALKKRHEIYNDTVSYIENKARQGEVFLIRPSEPLPFKRICRNPGLLQMAHDRGMVQGTRQLAALREFLTAPREE